MLCNGKGSIQEKLEKLKVVIEGATVPSVPTEHMTGLDVTLGTESGVTPGIMMESTRLIKTTYKLVESVSISLAML